MEILYIKLNKYRKLLNKIIFGGGKKYIIFK